MVQPAGEMGFKSGSKTKKAKLDVVFSHIFREHIPGDIAIALEQVLQEMGLEFTEISTSKVNPMGQESEVPFIRHQTEDGTEIPYGTYRVKGLGDVSMNIGGNYIPVMGIGCFLERPEAKPVWREFLKRVGESASKQSIFQGKALIVGDPEDLLVPRFLDLTCEVPVIFNPDIEDTLETCVFWPLLNRERCKSLGIRTRRGAILEGHYGAGKSVLLYKAAKLAFEHNWGVLHVKPGMIRAAMAIAPMLQPICIIIEDMDAGVHGERDRLNEVLNSISSVATKSTGDYMMLVSTNFLSRIDPAMLRPERIDAIIPIELPTRDTIERLINLFSNGSLKPDESLNEACQALEGCTPAIISEVIQRAMIDGQRGDVGKVTAGSIIFHTKNMARQKELAIPEYRKDSNADNLEK